MGLFDWFKTEKKSVPPVGALVESTRGGISKAYMPKFLFKPPFGYPRYVDLVTIRRLASTPYVEMCISTIIDELCAVRWEIVPKEEKESKQTEEHIKQVKNFFENPNTNKESFEEIRRKYFRDILEIDAGVLNKIFNQKGQMVELVARDGGTFTKNPDIYGMYTDRDDLMLESDIIQTNKVLGAMAIEPGQITDVDARERAAYFQYGWVSGARPVPFGKREIMWLERNPRTDSFYGRSPVQNLADTIQTLIYAIEHNLEYFNDNSIPKGVLGFEGSNSEEIKAFQQQWEEQQRAEDGHGNWKKKFHKLPMLNRIPKFERFSLTNAELELLEAQKWWAKMVWACFGVTSVELGYTEDSKGLANQIVQSNVFKKRTINPLLRLEEYHINKEIISEFEFDDVEFKFLMFDVEEETKKAQLYQLQLNAGYKSVNEIRQEEGLEEVEWGEKKSQEEMIDLQNKYREDDGPSKDEENSKKKDIQKEKENLEKKATEPLDNVEDKSNPLILGPNEELDDKKLKRALIYLMKQNEEKILKQIEKEGGRNKLAQIKSLESLSRKIKSLLSFSGLRQLTNKVIENTYVKGWETAEKQVNRNLSMNKEAIGFIQDYTYDNIKGMTSEIADDLRQELERGIMGRESITKIKERIKGVFDVGENRSEMIARTETNRAENEGKLRAFKSTGKDYKKKWLAALDDRTSPICKRLDGQIVNLDENFKDSQSGWEGQTPPSHVNCFDKETEVYTENGWKFFKELNKEKIWSLNPETLEPEWVNYKNFIKKKSDKIVEYKSNNFDTAVTPDHNQFVKFRKKNKGRKDAGKWKLVQDNDLPQHDFNFYRGVEWTKKSPETIKIGNKEFNYKYFARFLGWFISEGSYTQGKNCIKISQESEKHMDKLIEDMINVSERVEKWTGGVFIFDKDLIEYVKQFGKSYEKFIPNEIKEASKEVINEFLDTYCMGDGSIRKGKYWKNYQFNDSRVYFTSSKQIADDLTELLMKIGKTASFGLMKTKGKKVKFKNGEYTINHDVWRVYELSGLKPVRGYLSREVKDYNDYVYDVELEKNHILLTRRNGKIVWSGNCRSAVLYLDEDEVAKEKLKAIEQREINLKKEKLEQLIRERDEKIKTKEMELAQKKEYLIEKLERDLNEEP